ncbi:MAG: alginate lyase family protein, partial [Candidatus Latescibacterota bacterium]
KSDYYLSLLQFFPEFKESEKWRDLAIQSLYLELDAQVYPDGAQIELSSGYHQVSLRNFVMGYAIGQLNGMPVPDDFVDKLERMYHYDLFMAMPNLLMPALNDGGQTDISTYLRGGFKFFPKRKDFQWAATSRKEGTAPANVSSAFPYAGHFVMRSGWDEQDRYLFFDGGPFGYGHQHEDKLNMMVYAYGRVHVVDPGNYPYDSSQWRAYVLSTRAHNTVMIDGLEQNQRGKPREEYVVSEPLPHTWISEKHFDYVSASYDLGYGPERDTTVTHTRSILFVKPDFWIVTDFLKASDENVHTYDAMFHLDADGAALVQDGRGVETRNGVGESNLGIYGIANTEFSIEVVSGQEEPIVQGWIPRGKPYECQPIPTPVFKAQGKGTVVMSYVLYPIRAGEKSPVVQVDTFPVMAEGERAAIAGRVGFDDGKAFYFVQAELGTGLIRAGLGETNAEAGGMMVGDGKIENLILVNGDTLRWNGKAIKLGDTLV